MIWEHNHSPRHLRTHAHSHMVTPTLSTLSGSGVKGAVGVFFALLGLLREKGASLALQTSVMEASSVSLALSCVAGARNSNMTGTNGCRCVVA